MSLDFVGSPNFPDRPSPARHSTTGAKRSRTNSRAASLDQRLSIIDENQPSPPPAPKTQNRPFARRFLGEPPRYSSGSAPPKYTFWDFTGPKGEKFEDLRNNEYVAGRGGWKRICIIFLIVFVCLVGLVVGLAVGLTKNHSSSPASPPSPFASTTPAPKPGPYPSGSWTFTTYLTTISTNCTTSASSWQCEPAVTYDTDPASALSAFNWIIAPPPPNSPADSNFTIDSNTDPFSITFPSTPLTLLDAGTPTERYSFTATVPKAVFPSANVKCFYNTTQLIGNLYTKKEPTYPIPSSANTSSPSTTTSAAPSASPTAFGEWKYAVDATESIGGGPDVPECFQWTNGALGARVTQGYSPQPASSFCSCAYANYQQ